MSSKPLTVDPILLGLLRCWIRTAARAISSGRVWLVAMGKGEIDSCDALRETVPELQDADHTRFRLVWLQSGQRCESQRRPHEEIERFCYDADPSAADRRRFGRLPGFTNCKPKYKKPDGFYPFVRLKSHGGEMYPQAGSFVAEIKKLYEAREQEREARRLQASLSPQRGPRFSTLSLERFRTSSKYQDRPSAADIAFCVAAYANDMSESLIEHALEDDYLSRDPSPAKRASYIRRTTTKARDWASR